jgi:hypothetical protein
LDHGEYRWEKNDVVRSKLAKKAHDFAKDWQSLTRAAMIDFQPVLRITPWKEKH